MTRRGPAGRRAARRGVGIERDGDGRRCGCEPRGGRRPAVPVRVAGQLTVNGTGALLGAYLGGQGIAQLLAVYAHGLITDGRLVHVLPEWADEAFPLYAYHHPPRATSARVRVFLDYLSQLFGLATSGSQMTAGMTLDGSLGRGPGAP